MCGTKALYRISAIYRISFFGWEMIKEEMESVISVVSNLGIALSQIYGSTSLYGVQIKERYRMNKKEAERLINLEADISAVPPTKTPFELEMEQFVSQEKEIMNNTSLSTDQRVQALSSIDMVRQKMKAEHRKDLFSIAIGHNRPLFEAVKRFASGQGIEPAWSNPEALQSILKMHTEIVAKATDPTSKGALADINVRMKEIKSFREEIKSARDNAEQARKDAEDIYVRTNEKIRTVETELLQCAEDAFEIDPRYVMIQMPDIAAKLMGEVQTVPEKTPQTSTTPGNTSAIGPVNFQTVAGIQISTRRTMSSDANPHHRAMLDALTMDNVKKAVEAGAKSNSNIECLAWIGKNIVNLTEVVIDQGLNSKVSLIRQALNYPKG